MEESARMKRRTTVPGPVKMYSTRHKHEEPMQTPLGYMYVNMRFVVVCSHDLCLCLGTGVLLTCFRIQGLFFIVFQTIF